MCFVSVYFIVFVFFFKQKTAYEMRISDWSSDVCSSDLVHCRCGSGRRAAAVNSWLLTTSPRKLGRLTPWRVSLSAERGLAYCPEIGRASCRERVCQYV